MMVPKKSLILAGAALALFGASSSAQSQSGKVFARYNKPLKSASLDLATGTITRGPAVQNKVGTTTIDFANIDLGGFVGVDTGSGFCEWFDAGTKGFAGNTSDLMNDIVFAYCSALLSAASGGPGGSVTLGFYEGYTTGNTTATTTIANFTLNGLPANTASSSFFGGFRCFFLRVTFLNLVPFADGPMGYSWRFIDTGTDGVLSGTWPFLSCVQSCSGTGTDAQGMVDLIDEFCPVGTLRATFTFGTTPSGSYFTSMSMDVREATDLVATATAWNSQNINLDVLTANPIVVGGTWNVSVHVPGGAHTHGTGASAPMTAKVRTTAINGPNVTSPVGGRLTEVLINGPLLNTFGGTTSHTGAGVRDGAFPAQPVAASLNLINLPWAVQATVLGGGFADLSSAYFGVTGSI